MKGKGCKHGQRAKVRAGEQEKSYRGVGRGGVQTEETVESKSMAIINQVLVDAPTLPSRRRRRHRRWSHV